VSSSFSGFERSLAKLLARFPVLKRLAKVAYSRLMFLKNKKNYTVQSVGKLTSYSLQQHGSFFGYYDKSPENSQGLVLSHITGRSTKKLPSASDSIDLAVFDGNNQLIVSLPVNAYNWQQGCRAQWLDDDIFIFNDFDAKLQGYVARAYSLEAKDEVRRFEYPVQDVFRKDYFISLNYERLMQLRPDYGYRNHLQTRESLLPSLEQDGLWKVDFHSGKSQLFVSLADACQIKPVDEFNGAFHKFNHVMISPSGEQFIVMHRYLIGKRRVDRLLLVDANTGELSLLSDYGMVSHCFWADTSTILGYMRGPGGKDGYWLVNVESAEFTPFKHDVLSAFGDGHPHVAGDWFVTDTYPDKARMQHLMLCNWRSGEVRHLGEFFHGFEYAGETRCDLHPRLSVDGKAVFFDSVYTGQRQLYKLELPE